MIRQLLLALSLLVPIASGRGQSRDCAGCLATSNVVRIEIDRAGPQVVSNGIVDVIRMDRGEYLIGPVNQEKQLAVFSAEGRLLRTIGRAGNGPGEYHTITRVHRGLHDSVLVYDTGKRQLTVLSPALTYVRSMPFPDYRTLVHSNGWLVGIGQAGETTSSRRWNLHEARHGQLQQRVPEPPRTRSNEARGPRNADAAPGTISPAGERELWYYRIEDGLLALADVGGVLKRSVHVVPTWHSAPPTGMTFTAPTPQRGELPAVRGKPTRPWSGVNAVEVDRSQRLWLWGTVPRAGWERRPSPFQLSAPETRRPRATPADRADLLDRMNGWFEGRVDVLDISGAQPRSVGTAVFPSGYIRALGHGYVAGLGVHDDGSVFVDVWRVEPKAARTAPVRRPPRPQSP